jgi:hypothetical protein
MNARRCCSESARWLAPGIGLALIPKCPACVAAYVAAATGAGVSLTTATRVRLWLIALCASALALAAARTCAWLLKPRVR